MVVGLVSYYLGEKKLFTIPSHNILLLFLLQSLSLLSLLKRGLKNNAKYSRASSAVFGTSSPRGAIVLTRGQKRIDSR
jgi:hypothetical protein